MFNKGRLSPLIECATWRDTFNTFFYLFPYFFIGISPIQLDLFFKFTSMQKTT